MLPSKEFLQEALEYNSDTGDMLWKHRPKSHFPTERGMKVFNSRFAGKVPGRVSENHLGYRCVKIRVGDTIYYAHRLIWKMMTGEDPDGHIDHINRDATDNRWCNLRLATREVNSRNCSRRHDNSSGVTGVAYRKDNGLWQAYSNYKGKRYHLGFHKEIDEAAMAVLEFRSEHDYHEGHGKDKPYT